MRSLTLTFAHGLVMNSKVRCIERWCSSQRANVRPQDIASPEAHEEPVRNHDANTVLFRRLTKEDVELVSLAVDLHPPLVEGVNENQVFAIVSWLLDHFWRPLLDELSSGRLRRSRIESISAGRLADDALTIKAL